MSKFLTKLFLAFAAARFLYGVTSNGFLHWAMMTSGVFTFLFIAGLHRGNRSIDSHPHRDGGVWHARTSMKRIPKKTPFGGVW